MVEDVIELRPGPKPKKPKDLTNAERSRRFRAKRAEREAAEKAESAEDATPAATAGDLMPVLPATPQIVAQSVAQRRPAKVVTLAAGYAAPVLLGFAGIALAVTGIIMNARYAASLGGAGEGGTVLALVGTAVDVLAMALPPAAVALWQRGHRLLVVVPWCVWPIMVGLSLMAAIGYASVRIDDALAKRSKAATTTMNTTSDILRWRTERDGIAEKRSVVELEIQMQRERPKVDRVDRDAWDVTRACTRLTAGTIRACAIILPLRQALETAKRRDKLDEDIRKAEAPLAEAPPVTSIDPQAETVSAIVRSLSLGRITPKPSHIARLRIIGLVATPSMAGLILMLAMAFMPTRSGPHDARV
jgi:hypothetical protein